MREGQGQDDQSLEAVKRTTRRAREGGGGGGGQRGAHTYEQTVESETRPAGRRSETEPENQIGGPLGN